MTKVNLLNRRMLAGILGLGLLLGLACQPAPSSPTPTATVTVPTITTASVTIYFARSKEQDIEFVAVKRTVSESANLVRVALSSLLEGPTEAERTQGLYSPIPAGVRLLDLRFESGVAYPNFSKEIEVGGSVRVMAISQVIRRTLLEFPDIKKVVIVVEGQTEGVLQP